jgi:hypothetical protein
VGATRRAPLTAGLQPRKRAVRKVQMDESQVGHCPNVRTGCAEP